MAWAAPAGADNYWPIMAPITKYVTARGSPQGALKVAKDVDIGRMWTDGLSTAILTMPTDDQLRRESNWMIATTMRPYGEVVGVAGAAIATDIDQVTGAAGGGLGNVTWLGANVGLGAFNTLFSGAANVFAGTGAVDRWIVHDHTNKAAAAYFVSSVTKLAAVTQTNPAYLIRFIYERLMFVYGLNANPVTATPGQFTRFAEKYLGFTPGSDWRNFENKMVLTNRAGKYRFV